MSHVCVCEGAGMCGSVYICCVEDNEELRRSAARRVGGNNRGVWGWGWRVWRSDDSPFGFCARGGGGRTGGVASAAAHRARIDVQKLGGVPLYPLKPTPSTPESPFPTLSADPAFNNQHAKRPCHLNLRRSRDSWPTTRRYTLPFAATPSTTLSTPRKYAIFPVWNAIR